MREHFTQGSVRGEPGNRLSYRDAGVEVISVKLHILSDLHNEFGILQLQKVPCDVVILAGDVDVGIRGAEWIGKLYDDIPILYIPGNHEYYGKKLPKIQQQLSELAQDTNLYILDNDEYILDHVRFLGATLWTDFQLYGMERKRFATYEAQQTMTDYRRIRLGAEHHYRKLRPSDTIRFHRTALTFLEDKLRESYQGITIVVTHHAPSSKSLIEYFRHDLLSAAYCSDLEWFITQYHPHLWIHGHIHASFDYTIGETRILCNPRGYAPNEIVDAFQPGCVIDI